MGTQRLVLLGGTFDPPHNGHMSLLRAAVDTVRPTQVVVMPTGVPPHKEDHHTSGELRMKMCACFAPVFPSLTISDAELRRQGKSYTIDTVRSFCAQMPEAEIYLPMGSDMLLYFRKWKDWQKLAKLATLVVLLREAEDAAPVQAYTEGLRKEGVRIILAKGTLIALSSTEIREKIARGEDASADLPPLVQEVIATSGLYSPQPTHTPR